MGYRSDVKLILTDKGMKMLRGKIKKPTESERNWSAEPIYDAIKICDNKYWLIEWYEIKWYEDYTEGEVPYTVMKLLPLLRDLDESYAFLRFGEDYDDVEEESYVGENGKGFPWLSLKREINVEY